MPTSRLKSSSLPSLMANIRGNQDNICALEKLIQKELLKRQHNQSNYKDKISQNTISISKYVNKSGFKLVF